MGCIFWGKCRSIGKGLIRWPRSPACRAREEKSPMRRFIARWRPILGSLVSTRSIVILPLRGRVRGHWNCSRFQMRRGEAMGTPSNELSCWQRRWSSRQLHRRQLVNGHVLSLFSTGSPENYCRRSTNPAEMKLLQFLTLSMGALWNRDRRRADARSARCAADGAKFLFGRCSRGADASRLGAGSAIGGCAGASLFPG